MKNYSNHSKFSDIFTNRLISDLFYHISSQIEVFGNRNAYNALFSHKRKLIFTNEKIRRDYESGNIRKIKAIFYNFVKRLVLTGLNTFVEIIDNSIAIGIFDKESTIYDIDDDFKHEKVKPKDIYEMKKIIKHLMCCKRNLNLLNNLIFDNFDDLCNIDKMKKYRPEMLQIFDNLNSCTRCYVSSYTDGPEKAAAIIQNNYLYYRDTPVDLKSPNIENTLWWRVHTQRLQDIYDEYEIIIN